jgi:hypothetical protein
MLALLLSVALLGSSDAIAGAAPLAQDPRASAPVATSAVAVRGDTELTAAAAFVSARARVDEHVRGLWQDRAATAVATRRPFWLPQPLADQAVRRWLGNLSTEQMVRTVDREDRQREHEFGTSYQTTLWVAEDPRAVQRSEQSLRSTLQRLERTTVVKYGGIAVGWTALVVVLGWLDRLSRGYMTGRLRLVGVLGGLAVPTVLFLV